MFSLHIPHWFIWTEKVKPNWRIFFDICLTPCLWHFIMSHELCLVFKRVGLFRFPFFHCMKLCIVHKTSTINHMLYERLIIAARRCPNAASWMGAISVFRVQHGIGKIPVTFPKSFVWLLFMTILGETVYFCQVARILTNWILWRSRLPGPSEGGNMPQSVFSPLWHPEGQCDRDFDYHSEWINSA